MSEALDTRKVFDHQVHQTLTGVAGAVFPEGHQWAGLTKAQSFAAVKAGFESGAAYLASLKPAVAESVPTVSNLDTGKLDSKKK
jgi:hypothetical protein